MDFIKVKIGDRVEVWKWLLISRAMRKRKRSGVYKGMVTQFRSTMDRGDSRAWQPRCYVLFDGDSLPVQVMTKDLRFEVV